MELYGQEAEAELLAAFVSRLEHRSVIDVGAERGGFAEALIRAGAEEVHLIEPEPENVRFLRERFHDEVRVKVHEYAASDADAELLLHTSIDPAGAPLSFGHTLLDRPDTVEIAWGGTVRVKARTLASLVESGEIPARIGILKVDTEGHDFAVIAGMGVLSSDVVMVEQWSDLPRSLGLCPWRSDEMITALRARGFSNFALIVHRGEFTTLQWNDAEIPVGYMGNLIFVQDRALETLLPSVLECASSLAARVLAQAETQAAAARDRLAVIEELAKTADERLALINELTRTAEERLATIEAMTGLGHDEVQLRG